MADTYQRLQGDVLKQLERNTKQVEGRRKKIAKLASSIKRLNRDPEWRLRPRKGVWFSTTQSRATAGNDKGYMIGVQMLGREIGTIEVKFDGKSRYMFRPKETGGGAARSAWEWSKNPEHAKKIKEYLRSKRREFEQKNTQEREIQWQLAAAMEKDTESVLRGLAPVKWLFPTEVGVALTRKQEGGRGTGTIDLLARTSGGRNGGRFVVLEVKGPDDADYMAAVKQAIGYAIALSVEANDTEETIKNYRTAFGSAGTSELRFSVVVVMNRATIDLKAAKSAFKAFDPGKDGVVAKLGFLTYEWKDGAAVGWKWEWGDPR